MNGSEVLDCLESELIDHDINIIIPVWLNYRVSCSYFNTDHNPIIYNKLIIFCSYIVLLKKQRMKLAGKACHEQSHCSRVLCKASKHCCCPWHTMAAILSRTVAPVLCRTLSIVLGGSGKLPICSSMALNANRGRKLNSIASTIVHINRAWTQTQDTLLNTALT